MATYYWRGLTATWSSTNVTPWSLTPGGAAGTSVPTEADDVVFPVGTYVVTLAFNAPCNNFTASGGIFSPSASLWNIYHYGNFTTTSTSATFDNMTIRYRGSGASVLTLAGPLATTSWFVNPVTPATGSLTLGSAISVLYLYMFGGTFSTANFAVTAAADFFATGTSVKTLNLGSSTILVSNSSTSNWNMTNTTVNAGTSSIRFRTGVYSNGTGTIAFYNVQLENLSYVDVYFGNVTCNNLTVSTGLSGQTRFNLTSSITVAGTFTSGGGSNNFRVMFNGQGLYGLTLNGATTAVSNTDFLRCSVSWVGGSLTGTNLGDAGGNTGVTFAAAKTSYFRGATNTSFADSSVWSLTGGGATSTAAYPLPQDSVVYNTTGSLAYINGLFYCRNFSFPSSTFTISVSSGAEIWASGDFDSQGQHTNLTTASLYKLYGAVPGLTRNLTYLNNSSTIGVTNYDYSGSSPLRLASSYTFAGTFDHQSGVLDLNNSTLTVNLFVSSNGNTRSIAFGTSGGITAYVTGTTVNGFSLSSLYGFTYTGTPKLTLSSPNTASLRNPIIGQYNVTPTNALPLIIADGTYPVTFSSNNYLKSLTLSSGYIGTVACANLTSYGDFTLNTQTSTVLTGSFNMAPPSGDTATFTPNGRTINCSYVYIRGSGTTNLAGSFNGQGSSCAFYVNQTTGGVFNSQGNAISCGVFYDSSNEAHTVNLSTSAINITGTSGYFQVNDALSVYNAASSTINLSSTTKYFYVNNSGPYGTINITGTSGTISVLSYASNVTIGNLVSNIANNVLQFAGGSNYTFGNLQVSGGSTTKATINTDTPGTRANFYSSASLISLTNTKVQDISANAPTAWRAYTSDGNVDLGNNVGWLFAPVPVTLASNATCVCSVTPQAALTVEKNLGASSAVTTTATGNISITAPLAATALAESTATSNIGVAFKVAAAAASSVSATASLGVSKNFSAAVNCVSASVATVYTTKNIESVSGTAAITNNLSGTLKLTKPIAAAALSVVSTSPELSKVVSLSPTVEYGGSGYVASGYFDEGIEAYGTGYLFFVLSANTAACVASATANLDVKHDLAGDAVCTSTATAALDTIKLLGASVTAASTATAALSTTKPLAATAVSTVTATAALALREDLLSAAIAVTNVASASLDVNKSLAANVTATSTVAASINQVTSLASLDGTSVITNVVFASLAIDKVLTATGTVLTVIQGGLDITKGLQGDAQIASSAVADVHLDTLLGSIVTSVTDVVDASVHIDKLLFGYGPVLATVNGRIVYSHPNNLEDIGETSADVEASVIYAEALVVYPQLDVAENTIFADITAAQIQMSVSYGQIYAEATLIDLTADVETPGLFLYRKAA